jgi:TP901-1 family phage major tail protein
MSAQRGKELIVRIGDGGTPEVFTTVAGLRASTFSLNAKEIDATHAQSPGGWRELIGAGLRQAAFAGSGVFLKGAAADRLRAVFFAGDPAAFEVVAPGLGVFAGRFLIANLDYAGDWDGEATISMALASAGAIAFTAEP